MAFFETVISSPFVRTQQTAELLSGTKPVVDNRAGVLQAPPEFGPQIAERRKTDPFGVAGAIISIPELREPLRAQGQALKKLVQETIDKLGDGQRALIVSHDGTMVALEKILMNESFDQIDHTYGTLEGYTIDESLQITKPDQTVGTISLYASRWTRRWRP